MLRLIQLYARRDFGVHRPNFGWAADYGLDAATDEVSDLLEKEIIAYNHVVGKANGQVVKI